MHKCNIRAGLIMGPAFFWFVVLLTALASFFNNAQAQATRLPVLKLTVDSHQIKAEVAANAQDRSYGLMNRPSLPPDTGMLFVFLIVGGYAINHAAMRLL